VNTLLQFHLIRTFLHWQSMRRLLRTGGFRSLSYPPCDWLERARGCDFRTNYSRKSSAPVTVISCHCPRHARMCAAPQSEKCKVVWLLKTNRANWF
jgi:hypothetical protein